MTDLRRDLVRSVAMTGDHLRLVKHDIKARIREVEEELDHLWSEIEPLQRAHDALLKVREELYRKEAANG